MLRLTQFDGSVLELENSPQRIVSLVPSITENLIEFGIRPVGRTSFCIHPEDHVKDIAVVGGTKTFKASRVLKQEPDLVIANKEENRKEDIEDLVREGIPVWVTYPVSLDSVCEMMEEMVLLAKKRSHADHVVEETRAAMRERRRPSEQGRVLAFIWKDPWMVIGKETYASELLSYVGGHVLFTDRESRYPQVRLEEVAQAKPDFILLPSEPYEFNAEEAEELKQELSKRGVKPRILLVSGEALTWPGPRTARALEMFSKLIQKSPM